jgi:hypothetical protein
MLNGRSFGLKRRGSLLHKEWHFVRLIPSNLVVVLNLMDEDNPIDEIVRIEAELEELAEVSEQCRKIIMVSKAAIRRRRALLLFMMLGLFGSNQVTAPGSIAVALAAIASLGSNVGTLQQTMAAMTDAEALRSDLLGRVDYRGVGDMRV